MRKNNHFVVVQVGARERYDVFRSLLDFYGSGALYTSVVPSILYYLGVKYYPDPNDRTFFFQRGKAFLGSKDFTGKVISYPCLELIQRTLSFFFAKFLPISFSWWFKSSFYGLLFGITVPRVRYELYYLYSYTALPLIKRIKNKNGVKIVLNQIDLSFFEACFHFPYSSQSHFADRFNKFVDLYYSNNRMEICSSSRVVVNSLFSKNALVNVFSSGQPPIVEIPLVASSYLEKAYIPRVGPRGRRVLWVGSICERKGADLLFKCIPFLVKYGFTFDFYGPVQITLPEMFLKSHSIKFHGKVGFADVLKAYETHDVVVVPTRCDGFSRVLVEALSYGLPVVKSNNCADVGTDGVNVFVFDSFTQDALIKAFLRYAEVQSSYGFDMAVIHRDLSFYSRCYHQSLLSSL